MFGDILAVFYTHFSFICRMAIIIPIRVIQTKQHSKSYQTLPPASCKNVVVVGASFSGLYLAKRLSQSLPTGYRVVLIEPSSHFNHTFNFPRYTVIEGSEHKAFIPFDGHFSGAPEGIFERVTGEVKAIREGEVELANGEVLAYEFLALATGATQSPPARLISRTKKEAGEELRVLQKKIREAKSIALVGGGAVGIQLAGDIKTFLPEKRVVLIHSRNQLLPNFGVKLHDYVLPKLQALGVEVVLEERPVLPEEAAKWEATTLEFKDGRKELFDLVIPSTGQTPNTSLLLGFSDGSISSETGRILVHPTLQLKADLQKEADAEGKENDAEGKENDDRLSKIYALGDVAETKAPRMARAGMMQAELVRENIISQIQGNTILKPYEPVMGMEGVLQLTLGKSENVTYIPDDSNGGYLFPGKSKNDHLEVDKMWNYLGADLATAANIDA